MSGIVLHKEQLLVLTLVIERFHYNWIQQMVVDVHFTWCWEKRTSMMISESPNRIRQTILYSFQVGTQTILFTTIIRRLAERASIHALLLFHIQLQHFGL